ncbi:PQQ-binding-like beta-propeller repeat protein [Kitasatospora sp. NPDC091207]|uniref:outer membrane protein assembly factor BamB family protein n=1 Tax=Kitasatospora sp. NPDC091207 TaxID=3364083 RepID=UPI003803654E
MTGGGSPLLAGPRLVPATAASRDLRTRPLPFSVLAAATGEHLWSRDAEPLTGHAAADRTLLLRRGDGDYRTQHLSALDLDTGRRLWRCQLPSVGHAVLAAGRVVAQVGGVAGGPAADFGVRCFDARTGELLWRGPTARIPDRSGCRSTRTPPPAPRSSSTRSASAVWCDCASTPGNTWASWTT